MKSKSLRYRYNVIGFAIIAFFCLREGMSALFVYLGFSENYNIWILCSIATIILSCFIPTVIIENMAGVHPKMFKKSNVIPTFALVGYSYFIITIASILNTALLRILQKVNIRFEQPTLKSMDSIVTFVLNFIMVCILPAIVEEIFLRGYVLNAIRPYGQSFAIIASAVCFTFMHSQPQNLFPIFVSGVLLACIYCMTDSIYPCILLHFVNNTISFYMMYAQEYIGGISALSIGIYLNLFVVGFGLLSRGYLNKIGFKVWKVIKKDKRDKKNMRLLLKSPVAMLAIVLFLFFTIEQIIRGF